MSFILIIIGLFLLIKCADWFVDGCSNVAKALGIPSLIIGLTIVAFGTSAPEAAVSVTASIKGMNGISLGNVVGSNICNLLLVLGASGLFGGLTAKKKIITRDFIYAVFSSIVMFILTFGFFKNGGTEGVISRTNGLILLCFLGIYLYALIGDAVKSVRTKEEKTKFNPKDILYIVIGIAGIIFGGQLVVNSATDIAEMFNVSQNVIALTIVAIGTSLPELVTSVVAAKKGETDIAIGNVVGSNIFNIFFILGLSSAISPITFGFESFMDIIIMLIASVLVYLLTLKNYRIGNKKGIILLLFYAAYMVYILIR
ncbi:MAG: calcium/sodium antiporter [Bacilli bacterium]|nr:calcium/sodium antiporter [Bacilli bacterium]